MTVFEAVMRLAARPVESREDVFDIEVSLHGRDMWAEAAVAAISLAGFLEDSQSDEDLDAGMAHFQACNSAEILGTDDWFREIASVMEEMERELELRGPMAVVRAMSETDA